MYIVKVTIKMEFLLSRSSHVSFYLGKLINALLPHEENTLFNFDGLRGSPCNKILLTPSYKRDTVSRKRTCVNLRIPTASEWNQGLSLFLASPSLLNLCHFPSHSFLVFLIVFILLDVIWYIQKITPKYGFYEENHLLH